MNYENNKLEKLIQDALRKSTDVSNSAKDSPECLTEESMRALYLGTLTQSQREPVIRHLAQCDECVAALGHYYELMEASQSQAILAKLEKAMVWLKMALPLLAGMLRTADFTSLCGKLRDIAEDIATGNFGESVTASIENILGVLAGRYPTLSAQTRGDMNEYSIAEKMEPRTVLNAATKLKEEISLQLTSVGLHNREHQPVWAGTPELWILERLSEPMKQRAVRIRDWCEQEIDRLTRQKSSPSRCTAVGIYHCKRMLASGVSLLNALGDNFATPYTCYLLYTSVYCHGLAILLENMDSNSKCENMGNLLLGTQEPGSMPMWNVLGFAGQQEARLVADICQGYIPQSQQQNECAATQSLFMDGNTITVSPAAVAAIIRLADILDCDSSYLPWHNTAATVELTKEQTLHYLRHEVVESVTIDNNGSGHITLCIRYNYPQYLGNIEEMVERELTTVIADAKRQLIRSGFKLPEPVFVHNTSLFPQEHPYLKGE